MLLVHQCHSSIISSDFRDYSWVRLGQVSIFGLKYCDPETHLSKQNQDVLLGQLFDLGHGGEFGM